MSLVATDSAGQVSQTMTELRTIRDALGPTIEIISPEQDIVVDGGQVVEILLRVLDASSLRWSMSGGCRSTSKITRLPDAQGFVSFSPTLPAVSDASCPLNIIVASDNTVIVPSVISGFAQETTIHRFCSSFTIGASSPARASRSDRKASV